MIIAFRRSCRFSTYQIKYHLAPNVLSFIYANKVNWIENFDGEWISDFEVGVKGGREGVSVVFRIESDLESTILKLAGPLTAHERAVRFFMEESNITGK